MIDWSVARVVVTGGNGFVGSHLVAALNERGCIPFVPSRDRYDLRNPEKIREFFSQTNIDVLFNLAANVGGIGYNQSNPYSLFFDNIQLGVNLIHESIVHGVKKFIQIGTVCAYPKFSPVPFKEHDLWNGYPEETNAPYGLAKRLLLVQLEAARREFGFNGIYLLPTNLYGPKDNFHPSKSHVIPALICKCAEAIAEGKDEIEVWGSGEATRDFLYVTDAVEAMILAAEKYDQPGPLNLGSGQEVRIDTLVAIIAWLMGFEGQIKWNKAKPDGQPRRVLSTWRAQDELGWKAKTSLESGLTKTIQWYREWTSR